MPIRVTGFGTRLRRRRRCCPTTQELFLCKLTSTTPLVGQLFTFTITPEGAAPFVVDVAASLDLNCVSIGRFPIGSTVMIQETVPGPLGAVPNNIVVDPPSAVVSVNIPLGNVVVRMPADQFVQVAFTNDTLV